MLYFNKKEPVFGSLAERKARGWVPFWDGETVSVEAWGVLPS
jgi:hypothetical protein